MEVFYITYLEITFYKLKKIFNRITFKIKIYILRLRFFTIIYQTYCIFILRRATETSEWTFTLTTPGFYGGNLT